jgi:hypothetical protein
MSMQFSECVLEVVFSGANNGLTERTSQTLIWQILEIGAFINANLVPKLMKKRAYSTNIPGTRFQQLKTYQPSKTNNIHETLSILTPQLFTIRHLRSPISHCREPS